LMRSRTELMFQVVSLSCMAINVGEAGHKFQRHGRGCAGHPR
jgi:hypothetical protein